jgi:hypothetical protein
MSDRVPTFELLDKVKIRGDPKVYEIAKIDHQGVLIWTKVWKVATGLRYSQEELEPMVIWLQKPDGTTWTHPTDKW